MSRSASAVRVARVFRSGRRCGVGVSAVLACLLGAGGCLTSHADGDRDGIPDALEASLARQMFPVLHVSPREVCPAPLAPKPVLFRVRHPGFHGAPDARYVAINYVLLYDEDCGAGPHPGDDEPIVVFARWSADAGWVFDSLAGTAHTNTPAEIRTSSTRPDVWIDPNKHSNYARATPCPECRPADETWRPALFNVGEPDAPLVTDLGVVNPAYAGYAPWSQSARFLGAGVIGRDALGLGRMEHATPPPALDRCDDACTAQERGCAGEGCAATVATCRGECRTRYGRWDD